MNKSVLKKLAVAIPLLGVAVTGLMGISSPARAEDKPEVCEFNCGIGGKSNFSLNDAQVTGGKKVPGDIPGTTYTYSPDGKFRLVQGKRMYVEYVDKAAIADYSGQAQNIPGSITLRWPKAAYEAKTGELLDVEITLSDIALRVADYTNERTNEYELRYMIDRSPLVFMQNNACGGHDGQECNLFDSDIEKKLDPYFSGLVANTTSPPYDLVDSTNHLTYRFIKQDGKESDQEGTTAIGDFRKPGMVGSPGQWTANWDQADPMQPHVKVLSKGSCLRRNTSEFPWEKPGLQFGEEQPCKQAWSKQPDPSGYGYESAEMTMKSGLTIELANQDKTEISIGSSACERPDMPGELRITKSGTGNSVHAVKDSNGYAVNKALNGSEVEFTYKVENIGRSPVWDIKVTDSKGVKVTCPKTFLPAGESMTCTGTGIVK